MALTNGVVSVPKGVSTVLRLESVHSRPSDFVNFTYTRARQHAEMPEGSSPSGER